MPQQITGGVMVDQGEVVPFSHFETGGAMWTGEGPREIRVPVRFGASFAAPPALQLGVTMWDVSNVAAMRLDIGSEEVGRDGFTLRVSSWGDSRIARLRIGWFAIGARPDEDLWQID